MTNSEAKERKRERENDCLVGWLVSNIVCICLFVSLVGWLVGSSN